MEVKIKKMLSGFLREWSQAPGMLRQCHPSVSWGYMASHLFPSLSALACMSALPCFYIISISSIQQRVMTDFHSIIIRENNLISSFQPMDLLLQDQLSIPDPIVVVKKVGSTQY